MKQDLYTIQEVSSILGVSPKTLRRWEETGRIKPIRTIGNQRRYRIEDVKKLERRMTLQKAKQAAQREVAAETVSTIAASETASPSAEGTSMGVREPVVPEASSLRIGPAAMQEVSVTQPAEPVIPPAAPQITHNVQVLTPAPLPQESVQEEEKPLQQNRQDSRRHFKPFMTGFAAFALLLSAALLWQQTGEPGLHPGVKGTKTISTTGGGKTVLAASDAQPNFQLDINMPTFFSKKVTFLDSVEVKKALTVSGLSQLNGGIKTNNADINAGNGKLTASNVIYSLHAGSNITITGDKQNPTISATGGVTTFQGATGDVVLTGGSGISIAGTTITNNDLGSAQDIFKTITAGGTDITASSNTDKITFAAGSGISISGDSGSKTITIASSSNSTAADLWQLNGGDISPLDSTNDLLLGGTTPATSKFAFTGNSSGIPTVTLTNGSTGTTYLDATGVLGTTNDQALQVTTAQSTGVSGAITIASGNSTTTSAGSVTVDTGSGIVSGTVEQDNTFETGTDNMAPWTGTPPPTVVQDCTVAHSGSCSLSVSGPTFWGILQNQPADVSVTAGHEYFVSAWVKAATGPAKVYGKLLWNNGAFGVNYLLLTTVTTTTSGWTEMTGTGVAPAGATNGEFNFGSADGSSSNGVQYFDDMEVTDLSSSSSVSDLKLGATNAQRITIGNANEIGNTTINGGSGIALNANVAGVTVTGGAISLDGSGLLTLQGGGGTGGGILVKNQAVSTSAFAVQNAATNLFIADTTDNEIGIGTGANSLLATLDLRGSSGTTPVASVSGKTATAGLIVDNSGSGDIFTASSSGVPHFTIQNDGTIVSSKYTLNNGLLYTNGSGVFQQIAAGANGSCLIMTGGNMGWGTCQQANLLQESAGAMAPANITDDFLLGGTATGSARFAFTNNTGAGTPTASISANNGGGAAYLTGSGILGTTNKQSLTLGSLSTGNIILNGFGAGVIHSDAAGVLSSAAVNLTSEVSGILPVANGGTGADLTSGGKNADGSIPYFKTNVMTTLGIGADGTCLVASGGLPVWSSCSGSGGSNFFQESAGAIAPMNVSNDFLLGGNATGSAKFAFTGNAGSFIPVASIAATPSSGVTNGLALSGNGSIGSLNRNTLTIGGTSTGDIQFQPGNTSSLYLASNGRVGIGTTAPGAALDVNGSLLLAANGTIDARAAGGLTIGGGTNTSSLTLGKTGAGITLANFLSCGSLTTDGTGALTCGGTPTGINYWNQINGVLTPNIETQDLLLGSQATSSAKFAFVNVNNGTPTASVSATATGTGLSLAGNGMLQSLLNQTLTVGGNTTGDIQFKPGNSGSSLYLASNGNVGIGTTSPEGEFAVRSTDAGATTSDFILNTAAATPSLTLGRLSSTGSTSLSLTLRDRLNNPVFVSNSTNAIAPGALSYFSGALGIGTNNPHAILDVRSSSYTSNPGGGIIPIASFSGQTSFAGLVVDNSGVGDLFTASNSGATKLVLNNSGDLYLAGNQIIDTLTGGTLGIGTGNATTLTLGRSGQGITLPGFANCGALTTGSGGILTCGGTPSGINFWDSLNGVLTPKIETQDLLLGAQATTSAKFAFVNVNNGTPTASIAGSVVNNALSLTGDGAIATTNRLTLALGGGGTGNISLQDERLSSPVLLTQTATGLDAGLGTNGIIDAINKAYEAVGGTGTGGVWTLNGNVIYPSAIANQVGIGTSAVGNGQLVVNQPNITGDIFSASAAGQTKFTISNAGNLTLANYINCGSLTTTSGGLLQCGAVPTGTNYWDQLNGVLTPKIETQDLLLGSNATASAKFAFVNVLNGTPTASVSATATGTGLSLAGNGTLQSLLNQTLTIGGNTTGDIQLKPGNNGSSLYLTSNGNLGIGTNTPQVKLDVRGNVSGTLATASISGQTSFSTLVVDQSGVGDLFTASKSGATKLVLKNNGDLYLAGNQVIDTLNNGTLGIGTGNATTLTLGRSAQGITLPGFSNCGALTTAVGGALQCSATPTGTNYWQLNSGALAPFSTTMDLLLGSNATSSAKFAVLNMAGGTPTASVAGNFIVMPTIINGTQVGGYLGVGTTNPDAAFTLKAPSGLDVISLETPTNSPNDDSFVQFNYRAAMGYSGTDHAAYVQGGSGKGVELEVNGEVTNVPFYIDPSHNIMLGDSAVAGERTNGNIPAALLTVGGSASVSSSFTFDSASAPQIQSTANQTLTIGGATTGNIQFKPGNSSSSLYLASNGNVGIGAATGTWPDQALEVHGNIDIAGAGAPPANGITGLGVGYNSSNYAWIQSYGSVPLVLNPLNNNVGIGATSPLARLDVRGLSGSTPVASFSGTTAIANTIIDQSGSGDIFAASKSGATKLVLKNSGDLYLAGNQIIDTLTSGTLGIGTGNATTLTLGRSGQGITLPGFANCGALTTGIGGTLVCSPTPSGTNFWNETLGALSPQHFTDDFLLGGAATSSAKFAVLNMAGGTPTASVAGNFIVMPTIINGNQVGGKLGINTNAPVYPLDVNLGDNAGVTNAFARIYGSESDVGLDLQNTFTGGVGWFLDSAGSGSFVGQGNLSISQVGVAVAPAMTFVNPSNIGGGGYGVRINAPIFSANNAATLDVNNGNGTLATASVSGATSFASLLTDNSGSGDLFTASKSGATKFTILNNGNIQFGNYKTGNGVLYTDSNGILQQTAAASGGSGNCLSAAFTWVACGSGGGSSINYWQLNGTTISQANTTYDLTLGGTSTASAKFAFIGNAGNATPVASISAQGGSAAPAGLALSPGQIQSLNKGTLTLGGGSTGDIAFNPGNSGVGTGLYLASSGKVGVGTTTPNASFAVNGTTVLGQTNSGSALSVQNSNLVSVFTVDTSANAVIVGAVNTASVGTQTRNSEPLQLQGQYWNGSSSTSLNYQLLNIVSGTTPAYRLAFENNANKEVMTLDQNGNLGINSSSPLAALDVRATNATSPVASVSGATTFAGLVIDQSGLGDIFTASKSGATKFVITNTGSVGIGVASQNVNSPSQNLFSTSAGDLITSGAIQAGDRTAGVGIIGLAPGLVAGTSGNLALYDSGGNNLGQFKSFGTTGSLNIGQNSSAYIELNGGNNGAVGIVGINTPSNPLATFDVRGSKGTLAIASVSGATSFAGLTVDNSGVGDLFTASQSGATKFVIANSGNVGIGTNNPTFALDVNAGSANNGGLHVAGSATDMGVDIHNTSSGVGWFLDSAASGSFYGGGNLAIAQYGLGGNPGLLLSSPTTDGSGGYLFGENIPSLTPMLATLDIRAGSGIKPVASFSGTTTSAAQIVDQSGTGDIFTASKSGATKFVIDNSGNVKIQGNPSDLSLHLNNTNTLGTDWSFDSAAAGSTLVGSNLYLTSNANTVPVLEFVNPFWSGGSGSLVGINYPNNGNPLATLDVKSGKGTLPTASISGATSFAGLLVDNSGSGDLFTASKSGATKFTILNNGNIQFGNYKTGNGVLYTDSNGILQQTAAASGGSSNCLSAAFTWVACGGSGSTNNYWQLNNGAIAPFSTTADLLLGSTATTSADFAFKGVDSATPVASISAFTNSGNKNGLSLDASGSTIQSLNRNTLTLGGTTTGDISFNPGNHGVGSLYLASNGNVGVNTSTPAYTFTANGIINSTNYYYNSDASNDLKLLFNGPANWLDLQSDAGNTYAFYAKGDATNAVATGNPLLSFILNSTATGGSVGIGTESTGNGQLVVNQPNAGGDIFSASHAGSTKFVISNSGNVGIGTNNPGALLDVEGGNIAFGYGNGIQALGQAQTNVLTTGWDGSNDFTSLYTPGGNGLDATPKLTLLENGNVGIGTITPTATLDVAGNASESGNLTFRGQGTAHAVNLLNNGTIGFYNSVGGDAGLSATPSLFIANYSNVGIGDTSPEAPLTVAGSYGGNAAAIINQLNSGDIFSASQSGNTKFTISNAGVVTLVGGNATNDLVTSGTNTLKIDTGGSAALTIGGTNASGLNFGHGTIGSTFTGTGTFSVHGTTAQFGNGSSATIETTGNGTLTLQSGTATSGTGNIKLASDFNSSVFVGSATTPAPLSIAGGIGNNAALIVSNTNSGDLFTASQSGTPEFTITNAGGIRLGTNEGIANQCIISNGAGAAVSWGSCGGGASTNYWQLNGTTISQANTTEDLLLGGTSTASAKFAFLNNAGGTPTASVAGNFIVMPTIIGGSQVGGNVGIGTTNPGVALDINAGSAAGSGIRMTGTASDVDLQLINTSAGGKDWVFDTAGSGGFLNTGSLTLQEFSHNPLMEMQSVSVVGGTGGGQIGINVPISLAGGHVNATLDVRGNLATQPVASFSGATNNAGLVVDNSGSGDIFTASSSGLTRFVITNSGNVGIGLNGIGGSPGVAFPTAALQVGTNGDAGTATPRFIASVDYSSNAAWANGFASYVGSWTNNGLWGLGPATNSGTDNALRLGNVQTDGSGNPVNTFQTAQNIRLVLNGTLGKTALAALDVSAASATLPVASFSGATTNAAAIVDQSGTGDIFTASKSGATRFVVSGSGNVGIGNFAGNIINPQHTLDLSKVAGAENGVVFWIGGTTEGELGFAGGTNQVINGSQANDLGIKTSNNGNILFSTGTSSNEVTRIDKFGNIGIGTNFSTSQAKAVLDVRNTSNTTIASFSGSTVSTGVVVDQSGTGDIFTASKSGATKFTIKNSGTVIIGNTTNGIVFDPTFSTTCGSIVSVYCGTARPTKQIVLSAEYAGAVITASGSANTNGFMTSDASPSASAPYTFENYYQWVSSQTSQQNDYTVAVRVTLPKDFSGWPTSNAMSIDYNTNLKDANSSKLQVTMYNGTTGSATPVLFDQNDTSTADNTWTTENYTGAQLAGWSTAGQTAVIYLRMFSKNNLFVQVGDIKFNYLSAF